MKPQTFRAGLAEITGDWLAGNLHTVSEYDVYADGYDAEYADETFDHAFWKHMAAGAGTVCEIGCGSGRISKLMATQTDVVGVDVSPVMLAAARSLLGADFDLRLGDMCAIPAADNEFDSVFCVFGGFAYVVSPMDQLAAVREMGRVCKPGGRLIIDVPFHPMGHPSLVSDVDRRKTHEVDHDDKHFDHYWSSTFNKQWNTFDIRQEIVTTTSKPGDCTSVVVNHRTKVYTVGEIVFLLIAAGFVVDEVYGDYEMNLFNGSGNRIIVTATLN